MKKKWTRYIDMGIALLMAVTLLASLIVPYLTL